MPSSGPPHQACKATAFSFLFLSISMQIPVSSLRDTVLELTVFDEHRRKFDNFSSLMLEWKLSNETLAHFENFHLVEMVAKADGSGQTRLHGTVRADGPFLAPLNGCTLSASLWVMALLDFITHTSPFIFDLCIYPFLPPHPTPFPLWEPLHYHLCLC